MHHRRHRADQVQVAGQRGAGEDQHVGPPFDGRVVLLPYLAGQQQRAAGRRGRIGAVIGEPVRGAAGRLRPVQSAGRLEAQRRRDGLRRRPPVEVQPAARPLEVEPDRRLVQLGGVPGQLGAQPRHMVGERRLQRAAVVGPRPDRDPRAVPGGGQLGEVPQLVRQEQVPPAGHHAGRRGHPQRRGTVVDRRPESVPRLRVRTDLAQEPLGPPDGREVGLADGQRPHRTLHPAGLERIGQQPAERRLLLRARRGGPHQHVVQCQHTARIEGGGEVGRGDAQAHRLQRRIEVRADRPLRVPEVAGARGGQPAVAPGPRAQPGRGRQSVVLLVHEGVELAARAEDAAHVLRHHLEAPPYQHAREQLDVRLVLAVRRTQQHHRQRPGAARPVAVGEQHGAVPHGDPQIPYALDVGCDRLGHVQVPVDQAAERPPGPVPQQGFRHRTLPSSVRAGDPGQARYAASAGVALRTLPETAPGAPVSGFPPDRACTRSSSRPPAGPRAAGQRPVLRSSPWARGCGPGGWPASPRRPRRAGP